jgi:hypothetical protein
LAEIAQTKTELHWLSTELELPTGIP